MKHTSKKAKSSTSKPRASQPRTTAPLRTTPHQIVNILESISDSFVAFDTQMNYTYVNQRGGELLGRKPQDLIGKNYWTEYPEARGTPFANAYVRALETQTPIQFEDYYAPFDRWFENRIYPSKDGLSIFFSDITERKRAEEALRESEAYNRALFNQSSIGLALTHMGGKLVDANPAYLNIIGRTLDETLNLTYWDITPDKYAEQEQRQLESLNTTGKYGPYEKEYLHKDGHLVPVRLQGLILERGGEKFIWSSVEDISERKRAEEQMLESEERYRLLFNRSPVGVFQYDTDMRITDCNERFVAILQTSHDKIIGLPMTSLRDQGGIPILQSALEGREGFTEGLYRATTSSTKVWLSMRTAPLFDSNGHVRGGVAIVEDITERKRAEEEIKNSGERFETLFKAAPGSMMLSSLPDGKTIEVNNNFTDITGYTRDEALGKTTGDLNMWADPAARDRFLSLLQSQGSVRDFEAELNHKSGAIRNGLVSGDIITINHKKYLLGAFYDITERKQAETKIQQQLRTLEVLYSTTHSLIRSLDLQKRAETIVCACVENFGVRFAWLVRAEADGSVSSLTHFPAASTYPIQVEIRWDDSPTGQGPTGRAIRSSQAMINNDLTQDPKFQPWESSARQFNFRASAAFPLVYQNKSFGALNLYSDQIGFFTAERADLFQAFANQAAVMLENAQLYEQVQRYAVELEQRVAERTAQLNLANKELESFSYSVSHDLRAPLRAVSGFAEIVARRHRANLNEEGQHYVDNIVQASERMGRLIDDLLTYSRLGRGAVRRERVALSDIVTPIVRDLAPRLQEIGATLEVPDDLPTVIGDQTLLNQIFTNLFENALTYRKTNTPARVTVTCQITGDAAIVGVTDNGIGIPSEHHERIFNIFQRLHSDEEYPGTGIGLATVRKSAELLGGSVWIESKVGEGSSFFVKLPKD